MLKGFLLGVLISAIVITATVLYACFAVNYQLDDDEHSGRM